MGQSVHPKTPLLRGAILIGSATALVVAAAIPAAASPVEGTIRYAGTSQAVPGRYLVFTKDDKASASGVQSSAKTLANKFGGKVLETYSSAAHGFTTTMSEQHAKQLAANSSVKAVYQDQRINPMGSQATPPWGLDRLDQRSMPLNNSYTYPTGSKATHAYVIDTGVRVTHTELAGRASSGWDFVDNDANAADCHGHGTHVAGTIAGKTYGVSKNALIVGVRVLDCAGSGYYSSVIAGVDWVTAHAIKPAVANMSLGGGAYQPLDDAITRSIASGVTYAVAAGNSNTDACQSSPARTPSAITVGATGNYGGYPSAADSRASFSSWGACLDIFAPGVGIRSSLNTSDTAYADWSGTSMATPHVAGVIAQFLSVNPTATPAQVRTAVVGAANSGVMTANSLGTGSPDKLLNTPATGIPMPATTPTCATGSNSTAVKIPDLSMAQSSIRISNCPGAASAVSSLYVKASHPYRGDLEIRLIGPTGIAYPVKAVAKADNVANVNATYLLNLSKSARNGVWTLQVYDRYTGDNGSLASWSLTL